VAKPNYAITRQFGGDFAAAVLAIKEALGQEGFGILTEIDVSQTLKKKLGVNYPNYYILGACNPPNAYKALMAETEVGLLLPCNVIVFEKGDCVYISAIRPTIALTISDNQALKEIAQLIEDKLMAAVDRAVQ